jgi:hypothetical protein
MIKQTLKEWLDEGKERFGEDFTKWKFKCPACGHINTGQEFKDAGADPNDMYVNCIGRFTGKGSPQKGDSSGCNWAAYGLFGTLCKGRIVIKEGKEIEVFDFAEREALREVV